MPAERDPLKYFNDNYIPEPNSGCWLWMRSVVTNGCQNGDGYGFLRIMSRPARAHRLAWEIYRGSIPAGLSVLHRCDMRCCVNPDHLFLGTVKDNSDDMIAKKRERHPGQPGESNARAKLRASQVAEIRQRRQAGENWKVLAKEYGVSHKTIWKVAAGLTWGDR
jgi:hypothetical protein